MLDEKNNIQREILPFPDIPHIGLTTYDVKDPDTKYPPVELEKTPEEGYHFTEDMTDKYKGKFDQGVDDYDHLINPEERLHLAMTRQ